MKRTPVLPALRALLMLVAGLLTTTTLTGCLVAGYSSNGGAFLWPGGLGIFVVIFVVYLLLRRR